MTEKKALGGKTEKIALRYEEEIIGFYKKLQVDAFELRVVLELTNLREIEVCFPIESIEAKIINETLGSIDLGQKIGILRLEDAKNPVLVRKIDEASKC